MANDDKSRKAKKPLPKEDKMPREADVKMGQAEKPRKIMVQPLPQILDEIEDSITASNAAARDARKAAEEARQAGEKAANEAARVAGEAIARVEKIAKDGLALAELLNAALLEAAGSLQKRLGKK